MIIEGLIMQKSYYPKAGELTQEWHIVDASGQNLGRLAARIAKVLMGKHRPKYTPGVDMGDYVIVTNCGQITVTGNKMIEKVYYRHSGYPGGLAGVRLRALVRPHPAVRKTLSRLRFNYRAISLMH